MKNTITTFCLALSLSAAAQWQDLSIPATGYWLNNIYMHHPDSGRMGYMYTTTDRWKTHKTDIPLPDYGTSGRLAGIKAHLSYKNELLIALEEYSTGKHPADWHTIAYSGDGGKTFTRYSQHFGARCFYRDDYGTLFAGGGDTILYSDSKGMMWQQMWPNTGLPRRSLGIGKMKFFGKWQGGVIESSSNDPNFGLYIIKSTNTASNIWDDTVRVDDSEFGWPGFRVDNLFDMNNWVAHSIGLLHTTTNGGKTWQTLTLPEGAMLVEFADMNTGWAISKDKSISRIYKTTNGGKTWAEQWHARYTTKNGGFMDIKMFNKDSGYIVGNHSLIYYTNNGGGTNLGVDKPGAAFQQEAAEHSLSIFPNPGSGLFTLKEAKLAGKPVQVRVFDAQGRLVHSHSGTPAPDGSLALNLTMLPAGVYFVQLSAAGQTNTGKVVVE